MTSAVHEVQVTRLPLNSNHIGNHHFGVMLSDSKFSPLVLLGRVHDHRSATNEKIKQKKTNSPSIQYSQNSLRSSHFPLELFPSNSLQSAHTSGLENKSILKKQVQTVARRDQSPHIYGKERPRSVPCSPRKVEFRPCVIVFHFDSIEGNHVRSESQILTTEPKDRKQFLNRNHASARSKPTGSNSLASPIKVCDPSLHIFNFLPQPPKEFRPQLGRPSASAPVPFSMFDAASTAAAAAAAAADGSRSSNSSVSLDVLPRCFDRPATDFAFFEDESRRLWLRFAVDLGSGVSASDVLVKANLAGNRVRIVGTKSCGSQREEFHERCVLPMEVDPHMITARMDGDGRLFIEGLVVTQEHKKMLLLRRRQR